MSATTTIPKRVARVDRVEKKQVAPAAEPNGATRAPLPMGDVDVGQLVFASLDEFHRHCAAHPERAVYVYRDRVYDCTEFVASHPGGADIMWRYNHKDLTDIFHDAYNEHAHTTRALQIMLNYRVGQLAPRRWGAGTAGGEMEEAAEYGMQEPTAYPVITSATVVYKDFTIQRGEGLIWQAIFLTVPQYMHLIQHPVFLPTCRLFTSGFFEFFSKTQYYVIPLLWLPLAALLLLRGLLRTFPERERSVLDVYTSHATGARFSWLAVAIAYGGGVVFWTLMEYVLHRVVFHFETKVPEWMFRHPAVRLLHFVLHGIHHVIPMDPARLVFPPALFVVTATLLYTFFAAVLVHGATHNVMAAGVVTGYVAYDMTHYHIHHHNPRTAYFRDLKKYHHAHHYVDDTKGFGISSKLWDVVCGTQCRKH